VGSQRTFTNLARESECSFEECRLSANDRLVRFVDVGSTRNGDIGVQLVIVQSILDEPLCVDTR